MRRSWWSRPRRMPPAAQPKLRRTGICRSRSTWRICSGWWTSTLRPIETEQRTNGSRRKRELLPSHGFVSCCRQYGLRSTFESPTERGIREGRGAPKRYVGGKEMALPPVRVEQNLKLIGHNDLGAGPNAGEGLAMKITPSGRWLFYV